jgi:CheY-like chemotaxis protein
MTPPLRLLLVDDAPEIARVVQHLARRAGQDLVCRADVPSAWEYLHAVDTPRPDLVLLDVNLPGASGIDLFRRMQSEGGELA